MSSTYGEKIKISVFGESHGGGIGVVIDGLPAGEAIDFDAVLAQMARRAPGRDKTATPRKESDLPRVLSGMLGDVLTGAPLCAVIENTNTRSQDYGDLLAKPRPGHSDYTAYIKYHGANDIRGGGHFSGRITAPLVFAGAVCRQLLERRGIQIAAHIQSVGSIHDKPFDPVAVPSALIKRLSASSFALIDESAEEPVRAEIEAARLAQDSVGGTIECAVTGLPAGVGEPMFDGLEGAIAKAVFGVPAVKGIEFGAGFALAAMRGSRANDAFCYQNGHVVTETNHCGGILGGIANGMPLIFRCAVKPTPSISQPQKTVDLQTGENTVLTIHGRHDPCIVPRAVPVIEAVTALAIINEL
ncbi:MAG: chorismate synthase [Ruminococcus sp.]|nr:chorismate synthase [Ruminococcus sp.]MBQ5744370.1 chorismate synthase [Ruminococcus sp.]